MKTSNDFHPKQLIVGGFHRSGTSMLAQMLSNGGLYFGKNLMPPHPSNPDGHFEDLSIVNLHNSILSSNETTWKYMGEKSIIISDTQRVLLSNEIARLEAESMVWGFKDPRSCLFLDQWQSLLTNPFGVFVYRDYTSCWASLRRRQVMQLSYSPRPSEVQLDFWSNSDLPLRMWVAYNKRIIEHVSAFKDTSILISQEELVKGYPLIKLCNKKFDLNLNVNSSSGVRKSLGIANPRLINNEIDQHLVAELDEVLYTLDQLAEHNTVERAAIKFIVDGRKKDYVHAKGKLDEQLQRVVGKKAQHIVSSEIASDSKVVDHFTEIELVDSYIASHDFKKAASYCEKRIAANEYDKMLLIKSGIANYWKGDYLTAKKHLLKALKYLPKNPNVYIHLSVVSLQTDGIEVSNTWLFKCLEIAPKALRPKILLASNYEKHSAFKESIKWAEVALEEHFNDVVVYRTLANILIKATQFCRALKITRQGLELFPDDRALLNARAACLRALGSHEDADEIFYKILATDINSSQVYRHQLEGKIDEIQQWSDKTEISKLVFTLLTKLKPSSLDRSHETSPEQQYSQ